MKTLLTLVMMLLCINVFSQDSTKVKPEKIRYTSDMFGDRYELGDKDITIKEVKEQFHIHCDFSLHEWHNYEKKKAISIGFFSAAVMCTSFQLINTLDTKDKSNVDLAYGVLASTFLVSAITITWSGKKDKRRAIRYYNHKSGY